MNFSEKDLVVRRSTLPAAGQGLFTKLFIPKGTRIVEYKGKISTWKEATQKNIENAYVYYITRNKVIDASSYKKAKGRFANDARGLKKIRGLLNNATYTIQDDHVFIQAIKDIPAGSEIFVSYGKEYWDAIRYNLRLDGKL